VTGDRGGRSRWPNPVLPGFHPDPSVCRVGADYFLACSSFEYLPGLPLFHSRDLIRWRPIGHALQRPGQVDLSTVPASGGVFAPVLRHHGGRFWIATSLTSRPEVVILSAPSATGPWSDPVPVAGALGIDPDVAWDGDECWLTWAATEHDGTYLHQILQARVNPAKGLLLEEPRPIWSGSGLAYPEAPHLYHIGAWWYLLVAEGGTERGHAVSVARARRPEGPFDGCPDNPVLSHRSTQRPIQSTGHADLVRAPDGTWWALVLGVRPRGGTPQFHVLGRETFLTPVDFCGGWPMPAPVEERVDVSWAVDDRDDETVREDFDEPALAPVWVSPRSGPESFASTSQRPGWLLLSATDDDLDGSRPAFVGRRQQHHACRIRARVDARRGVGGLAVRIDERHHVAILVGDGRVVCRARIGPVDVEVAARACEEEAVLVVDVTPHAVVPGGLGELPGPDVVRLAVERDGAVEVLAELDGRYFSTEVAGGFTGRMIGMIAERGVCAFDWFDYEPGPTSSRRSVS
jgi:xylan 1,4-beta-xylosidase